MIFSFFLLVIFDFFLGGGVSVVKVCASALTVASALHVSPMVEPLPGSGKRYI